MKPSNSQEKYLFIDEQESMLTSSPHVLAAPVVAATVTRPARLFIKTQLATATLTTPPISPHYHSVPVSTPASPHLQPLQPLSAARMRHSSANGAIVRSRSNSLVGVRHSTSVTASLPSHLHSDASHVNTVHPSASPASVSSLLNASIRQLRTRYAAARALTVFSPDDTTRSFHHFPLFPLAGRLDSSVATQSPRRARHCNSSVTLTCSRPGLLRRRAGDAAAIRASGAQLTVTFVLERRFLIRRKNSRKRMSLSHVSL